MRGSDDRTGELFSYVDLEARVRTDHTASDPGDRERGAVIIGAGVLRALFTDRAPLDPSGEAVEGDAVAGVLFDPLGAATDGAAGVRSSIPLVRRARRR